jgi:hypothetical protein
MAGRATHLVGYRTPARAPGCRSRLALLAGEQERAAEGWLALADDLNHSLVLAVGCSGSVLATTLPVSLAPEQAKETAPMIAGNGV